MSLNFKLTTPFIDLGVRTFPFADPSILNPNNANPMLDGEFLELNSSYKLVRGAAAVSPLPSFAYFLEQGAYTAQGLGKGPVLMLHGYEAESMIFDTGGSYAYGKVCGGEDDYITNISGFAGNCYTLHATSNAGAGGTNIRHWINTYTRTPFDCWCYPFGDQDDPASWLDVSGMGNLRLILTQGGTGYVEQIVVQQAHPY